MGRWNDINMNRKDKTKFLSRLLEKDKLNRAGHYWAKEVTLDYGTNHPTRVDYLEFSPCGQIYVSDIEKGFFTCWEIKSCKEDFNSGFGRNFFAEKNYFIMDTYKKVAHEVPHNIGVYVSIPIESDKLKEFEHPTPLSNDLKAWKLVEFQAAYSIGRKRSMNELLFCMLRAGH